MYGASLLKYIEGYVQKVSPQKTPAVVGALLDAEAPDDFVNNLILSVRSLLPVDELVEQVEKRNRLKLLTPFLEHLIREGSTDPHVHDALGKVRHGSFWAEWWRRRRGMRGEGGALGCFWRGGGQVGRCRG